MGKLRKKHWKPYFYERCPEWQHAVKRVWVDVDLQTLTFPQLDYMFAVFASNGWTVFVVHCSGPQLERWRESVERRAKGAAERYDRKLRAHFRKCRMRFLEGYSLPAPPTPELRVIYDSAAKSRRRPANPCRSTLCSGWDGGEYHWRGWPLNNVVRVKLREGAAK